jgi:hypothetical protein
MTETRLHVGTKINHQTRQTTHYYAELAGIRSLLALVSVGTNMAANERDRIILEQEAELRTLREQFGIRGGGIHTKDECATLIDLHGYCPKCEALGMLGAP